jgi:hypothetical protein
MEVPKMKKRSYFSKSTIGLFVIFLLVLTACTPAEPATSSEPVPAFPPVISYVDTYVTEAGSSTGANVNFFVRIPENPGTSTVHIVYYYDVTPPTTLGQPAYTAPGTYVVRVPIEESVIWKDVPPGMHTFSAQLVKPEDDTPFAPPIIAQSIVVVPPMEGKTPQIKIMSVQVPLPIPDSITEPTREPISQLTVEVNSAYHFIKLNHDNIGKQNVPGEGHIIYYLDVEPPVIQGQSATTDPGTFQSSTEDFHLWENVSPGRHIFSVQLVNNDNTPLDPVVMCQTIVTIPSKF